MTVAGFEYSREVTDRFPSACGEVLLVDGVDNSGRQPDLETEYRSIQSEVAGRLAETPAAELGTIRAWRSVFAELGLKPTQHRNAAEALLRRLGRHGDIPSINPVVDIGNMISIQHGLPVAVFDASMIDGVLRVTFARGGETFTGIGSSEPEDPAAGEVVFLDDTEHVAARRWCWKQAAATATSPTTTSVLFVIEAVHDDLRRDLARAASELECLLARFQPTCSISRKTVTRHSPHARLVPCS